ncbi:MAG TPA: hypothetical protein VFG95_05085, partial [Nitrospiria bacterium]|nr:hypothetical protein [Nitrospiria bacterium]
MMQKQTRWHVPSLFSILFAALLLAACGGGDNGGGGPTVGSFQGTWQGAIQQGNSEHTFAVVVDASGKITDLMVDGTSQNVTGTIAAVGGNIFSFALSNGTNGGFMIDSSATHAGFLDEFGSFGVVQKGGTTPLPTYALDDSVGSWAGYSLSLNNDFSLDQTSGSSATINSSHNISGSSLTIPFTGNLTSADSFGKFPGTWTTTSSGNGNLAAWMSEDKTFMASWECQG